MKKIIIILLAISHITCFAMGYYFAMNRLNNESKHETQIQESKKQDDIESTELETEEHALETTKIPETEHEEFIDVNTEESNDPSNTLTEETQSETNPATKPTIQIDKEPEKQTTPPNTEITEVEPPENATPTAPPRN